MGKSCLDSGFQFIIIIVLSLPFFVTFDAFGQRTEVKNVSFQSLENNVIVVHYDLEGKARRKYVVELELRRNSRRGFMHKPKNVIGDIGKGRFAGTDNKIIWSIDHDISSEFKADPFADDYFFVVKARRKTRFTGFFFLVTAGVGGWYIYNETEVFD